MLLGGWEQQKEEELGRRVAESYIPTEREPPYSTTRQHYKHNTQTKLKLNDLVQSMIRLKLKREQNSLEISEVEEDAAMNEKMANLCKGLKARKQRVKD